MEYRMMPDPPDRRMPLILADVVQAQKRGRPCAVYAACTANAYAIRAVMGQALEDGTAALLESTASQVNTSGGYSGLTPSDYRRRVLQMAADIGLPAERVILGGDHLGPHLWRHEGQRRAMAQATRLVAACVAAGYRKIHLDAVTPCRDDALPADGTLDLDLICRRTAALCRAAEQSAERMDMPPPWYVIGSDVPAPGGEGLTTGPVAVTEAGNLHAFLSLCRHAFDAMGLAEVWPRVFAVVARTGAEYSPVEVHPYRTGPMQPLVAYVRQHKRLVLEAHSTDFQSPAALTDMVRDHFGVLKVGPALTFAMREAFFALARMEQKTLGDRKSIPCSRLPEVMEALMVADPRFWRSHYRGTTSELAHLRENAYSDRIRYYWDRPEAVAALGRLNANLRRFPPPLALIGQHLPGSDEQIGAGMIPNDPEAIVVDWIGKVAGTYARACSAPSI